MNVFEVVLLRGVVVVFRWCVCIFYSFFSGIGGNHLALRLAAAVFTQEGQSEEKDVIEVVEAFDVNQNANETYRHNFGIAPRAKDVTHLSQQELDGRADIWLLSPPCQPYTQGGKRLDSADPRALGLLHLVRLFERLLHPPRALFLENVKNFEVSESHRMFLNAIRRRDYLFEQYLLSPTDVGVPNSRERYYCIAYRSASGEPCAESNPVLRSDNSTDEITTQLPMLSVHAVFGGIPARKCIGHFLEKDLANESQSVPPNASTHCRADSSLMLTPDSIRRNPTFRYDIVNSASTTSITFTKAYGQSIGKSGPLIDFRDPRESVTSSHTVQPTAPVEGHVENDRFRTLDVEDLKFVRLFTPREIATLHGFLRPFEFPLDLSRRQCYALLGNSVSVQVIEVLLHRLLGIAFQPTELRAQEVTRE